MNRPIQINYDTQTIPESIQALVSNYTTDNKRVIEALSEIGLPAYSSTITKKKDRENSSDLTNSIEFKLEVIKRLASKNTELKDKFLIIAFQKIAETSAAAGLTALKTRKSEGVTEITANEIGIPSQPFREVLRMARAEFLFELNAYKNAPESDSRKSINLPKSSPFNKQLIKDIATVFRTFLNDMENFPKSRKDRSPYLYELPSPEESDINLILNTYKVIYEAKGPRAIGMFAVYEASALTLFYENKVQNRIVSSFDIYAMDRFIRARSMFDKGAFVIKIFTKAIQKITGIPIAVQGIITQDWINLLVDPSRLFFKEQ